MNTKLIELEDGVLVEVEVSPDYVQPISGGLAEKVSSKFEDIKSVLQKIYIPITDTWSELNNKVRVEQAEIEIGLSFEGEGNLYVTKSKAGANLTVKLVLKSSQLPLSKAVA